MNRETVNVVVAYNGETFDLPTHLQKIEVGWDGAKPCWGRFCSLSLLFRCFGADNSVD